MTTMVFTYDFPHYKTQLMLWELFVTGVKVEYVIGAPWRELHLPPSKLRVSERHTGVQHPQALCQAMKIPYHVFEHNGQECQEFLQAHPVNVGIIAGARILKKGSIDPFKTGVLNLHPGYLPHVRGLDTLKWSIYLDQPIGVTAHLIDPTIDAGKLLFFNQLKLYPDDTFMDISLRLVEVQAPLLTRSLELIKTTPLTKLQNLTELKTEYHSSMSLDLEAKIPALFPNWLKKYAATT